MAAPATNVSSLLRRCFSTTVRTCHSSAAASSRPALSTRTGAAIHRPSLAHGLAPQRGLQDFFDNEKGWTWNEKDYPTGRAWKAADLRIKSFEDLHKLWWVCIKEQNKLYSQQVEARRFDLMFPYSDRFKQVKSTMKAIKVVLWERRIAWMQAQYITARSAKLAFLRNLKTYTEEEIQEQLEAEFPASPEQIGRKRGKILDEERKQRSGGTTKGRVKGKKRMSSWTIV
ncbi:mitochondrial 39-S ribosomal protein L47 (MRP-L47)-domain-containing protein [Fimicolochytrium jonesii]|uniref:mitochondrial 39-S ribosomal protein L47 (MRP-L47)-domain-containing protein n=1 Tax=Fimicolochytrium jonesii TaxID=1396493 RepID=UPI0022FDB931|nr:mitochondrial 39-S ribosomal protein L47 (MRP-L47)-domain-containing protein [Fimicolochytrium jonesii]KAI8819552.1 mitochondrial 39-S ribosomal protein L47 (MRP-L47)-domain-containing protein [Fimicolochytrium jonesii]